MYHVFLCLLCPPLATTTEEGRESRRRGQICLPNSLSSKYIHMCLSVCSFMYIYVYTCMCIYKYATIHNAYSLCVARLSVRRSCAPSCSPNSPRGVHFFSYRFNSILTHRVILTCVSSRSYCNSGGEREPHPCCSPNSPWGVYRFSYHLNSNFSHRVLLSCVSPLSYYNSRGEREPQTRPKLFAPLFVEYIYSYVSVCLFIYV